MSLDLLTLTNLYAFVPVLYNTDKIPLHVNAATVASMVMSIAFHATENGTYEIHGVEGVNHELGEGFLIPLIVPQFVLEFGRKHTDTLLWLDENFALLLVGLILCNLKEKGSYLRNNFMNIWIALSTLIVSDFMCKGWPHTLLHCSWHLEAFSLVHLAHTHNSQIKNKNKSKKP